MANVLSSATRGDPQQLRKMLDYLNSRQSGASFSSNQPQNTIMNEGTGQYLSPQGDQSTPYQFQSAPQQSQMMPPTQMPSQSNGTSPQDLALMLAAAKNAPSGALTQQLYTQANPSSDTVINPAAIDQANKQSAGMLDQMLKQKQAEAAAAPKAPTGYRYKQDGTLEAIPGGPAANSALEPNQAALSGVSGKDYLSMLPASEANIIKALDEGKMNPPSSFALKSPYWQKIYNDWAQYNPNLDAVNYGSRYSTRRDFTSGASAKNLNALNTAIGHLGQLSNAVKELNNGNFTPWNAFANYLSQKAGKPAVTNFDTTKQAVANEMMRVFRQAGASDAEIQEWAKPISSSNSPDQLNGAIRTAANLLQSRIEALNNTYNRGMGTANVDTLSAFISPHARQVLDSLKNAGEKDHAIPHPVTQPPQINSDAEYEALPSGAEFIAPDGSHRRKP